MAKDKADQDRRAIDFEAKIKTSRIDAEKSIAKANAEFATELQRAEAAKKLLESQILELQRGNELKARELERQRQDLQEARHLSELAAQAAQIGKQADFDAQKVKFAEQRANRCNSCCKTATGHIDNKNFFEACFEGCMGKTTRFNLNVITSFHWCSGGG